MAAGVVERGHEVVLIARGVDRRPWAERVKLSFLRARPEWRSAYHESKWAAEQLVRASGLERTVLKPGMMYGLGDHMLDHLSHARAARARRAPGQRPVDEKCM
jgi:uncharacterized protein YbjT (DUF2867 family)